MSHIAALQTTFAEWLLSHGYDKTIRAFRKDASLPPGKFTPIITMDAFGEHLNKELEKNIIKVRNETVASTLNLPSKRALPRDTNDNEDGEYDENDEEQSNKRAKTYEQQLDENGEPKQYGSNAATSVAGSCDRVFLGNLAFRITEAKLHQFFADCGNLVQIDWVTDKTTGKFYGSAFATFDSPDSALKAVSKSGKKCLERPIAVNLAGHKDNYLKQDVADRKQFPAAPRLSDMPEHSRTLFMGNLSFDVSDEQIRAFFGACGSIYDIRFRTRDDGSFMGIGWIEFEDLEAVKKASKLHGRPLAGRPVRLDWCP